MAISFMADNGESITCSQDAALYNLLTGGQDCVIGGIGNELEFNSNASSLICTLSSGEAVICGRHVTVTGANTQITLSANRSGNIVLRYDLTQTGANIVRLLAVDTLLYEDLNNSAGARHDLLIGQYVTNASGVTEFTDKRNILSSIPATALNNTVLTLTGGATGSASFAAGGNISLAVAVQKLATARTIALTGAVAGSASFDGSGNISIATSISTAPAIYSGTTEPTSALGKNGDIYILYSE